MISVAIFGIDIHFMAVTLTDLFVSITNFYISVIYFCLSFLDGMTKVCQKLLFVTPEEKEL